MNNYAVPNLVKACEIMSNLAERTAGISAAELEDLVQVPRTTAFRILKTLCSVGMAEKRGTLYFSGPVLIQMGLNSLHSLEIRSLSIPYLSELATKTGLTAHLAIPSGRQSLILEVHDSPHPVRVASRPGTTVPLYCSSTGKIFLAYLHKTELEDYFKAVSFQKHTDTTITTLKEMKKEVARIEINGYSVDDCEFHEDVRCLAAPVRNSSGQVIAAIGVTGPAAQFNDKVKVGISNHVTETALRLSAVLGYHA